MDTKRVGYVLLVAGTPVRVGDTVTRELLDGIDALFRDRDHERVEREAWIRLASIQAQQRAATDEVRRLMPWFTLPSDLLPPPTRWQRFRAWVRRLLRRG